MRRTVLLALATSTALCLPAHAGTSVGAENVASTFLDITTAGGVTYQVELLITSPTAASTATAPQLRLLVWRDGSSAASGRYSRELPVSATSVGTDAATLRTRLGGVPLTVSWKSVEGSVTLQSGDIASAPDGSGAPNGFAGAGQGAIAQVRLGKASCTSTHAYLGVIAAHDAATYGAPVAQAFGGRSLVGARCAEMPSTSIP